MSSLIQLKFPTVLHVWPNTKIRQGNPAMYDNASWFVKEIQLLGFL